MKDLCWIPFGINNIQVGTNKEVYVNLEPNGNENGDAIQESLDHFWLRVHPRPDSSDNICTQFNVQYGCIITGPFVLPDGYKLVSPVLYLDMKMDLVSKPIALHIPHWSSDPTSVRYITAPHEPNPERKYVFQLLSTDENTDTLKISHLCLIAKVVKMTIPERYYISWWEKQELDDTSYIYRVVVTFALGLWLKVRMHVGIQEHIRLT